MIFVHKTPFFRITAVMVTGIISATACPNNGLTIGFFLLGCTALAVHVWVQRQPTECHYAWRWLFGLSAFLLFATIGRIACEWEQLSKTITLSSQFGSQPFDTLIKQLRDTLGGHLGRYTEGDTQALLRALLLGDKSGLSFVQRNCFREAGCAHILAVSGLHVGIVFAALRALCRRPAASLVGRLLQASLQLGGLWTYALLCGMPPSVVRSALMFSVIALSHSLQQHANTCNSVFFSAFMLLLYRPSYLYDIGFQLSYTAVIGILAFARPFQQLLEPATWIGRQIWALESVSLAAQLATAPLCLHYFKSFPIYFPLSNLIAVPAATGFVYLGIGLLAAGLWPPVGQVIGWLLDTGYHIFFGLLSGISRFPYATLHIGHFDWIDACWLALLLTSALLCLLHTHKLRWLYLHLGTLCTVLTVNLAGDLVLLLHG
ncbi:MAG: ComEC/Rec2 family competence protein [Paludibacteraceae bacterium]|nr:ComEC/Rec2 family competence protein [Paludibacteraceae bacterium]